MCRVVPVPLLEQCRLVSILVISYMDDRDYEDQATQYVCLVSPFIASRQCSHGLCSKLVLSGDAMCETGQPIRLP